MSDHIHLWEPCIAEVMPPEEDRIIRLVRIRLCLECFEARLPTAYVRGQLQRDLPGRGFARLRAYPYGGKLPHVVTNYSIPESA